MITDPRINPPKDDTVQRTTLLKLGAMAAAFIVGIVCEPTEEKFAPADRASGAAGF